MTSNLSLQWRALTIRLGSRYTVIKQFQISNLVGWEGGSYSNLSIVNENQRRLEERLNLSVPDQFLRNIPIETLTTAAEMFIYLNSCPEDIIKSEKLKSFEDVLSKENGKNILLFLNRLITSSNEKNDVKTVANAILDKISNLKGLQFKKIHGLSTSSLSEKMKNEDVSYMEKG